MERYLSSLLLLAFACAGGDRSPMATHGRASSAAAHAAVVSPQLEIAAPFNKQYFPPDADIAIVARIEPPVNVRRVEFFINGLPIGTDCADPLRTRYRPESTGQYTLTARAHLASGAVIESAPVVIVVREAQQSGEISDTGSFLLGLGKERVGVAILEPTAGSQFNLTAEIRIVAEAASAEGSVARIAFFVDGNSIATRTERPYEAVWKPTSPGRHVLSARVRDSLGNEDESKAIEVEIVRNF